MPKTPKTPPSEPEAETISEKRDEQSAWGEDQKKREYYYDDAHGYEVYKPDEGEKQESD